VIEPDKGKTRKTAFREFPISSSDESPKQRSPADLFTDELNFRHARSNASCRKVHPILRSAARRFALGMENNGADCSKGAPVQMLYQKRSLT
jgi:hypothetical protein